MSSFPQKNADSSYIADAENLTELARLIHQDRLISKQLGGLFPQQMTPDRFHTILDVGCGPGGWVLDVAAALPKTRVVGIDISKQMIKHARLLSTAEGVPNAEFLEMDARQPLSFPDASFDMINARFIVTFITPKLWFPLAQECYRLLKPGGVVRFTELESSFTSSYAAERVFEIFMQAMHQAGRTLAPTGRSHGTTPLLRKLLADTQFTAITHQAHGIDCSFGTEFFQGWAEEYTLLCHALRPFILGTQVTSPEEFDLLFHQATKEIHLPDFCAMSYFLSVWGKKP